MSDTVKHIIDTTNHIINIINPVKTDFEIYAPYIAIFVSLLTILVTVWLNQRQIRNSHLLLEKTIAENWKNNLKETKLSFTLNDLKLLENSRKDVVEELHIIEDIFKSRDLDKEKLKAIVNKFESSYAEFLNLIVKFDEYKDSMFSDIGRVITNIIPIKFILQVYVKENNQEKEELDLVKRKENMDYLYKIMREFNQQSLAVINKLRDEILSR